MTRGEIGVNIPISFRSQDAELVDWLHDIADSRNGSNRSVSGVVRDCVKIVKNGNLLKENDNVNICKASEK